MPETYTTCYASSTDKKYGPDLSCYQTSREPKVRKHKRWRQALTTSCQENPDKISSMALDFDGVIRKEVNRLGEYADYQKDDMYNDAVLEVITFFKQHDIREVVSLPGFIRQHLHWWFSKKCRSLNRNHAHYDNVDTDDSKQMDDFYDHLQEQQLPSSAETSALDTYRKRVIHRCVDNLEEPDRTVIKELFFGERTARQVAQAQKCSAANITKIKKRALGTLKEKFTQQGITLH